MAYNILKGTVEFTGPNGSLENTVDLKSDQSIDGGKTFNQRLTASAITLGGSTLTHPLITGISSAATNRVTLWSSGTQVSGSQYLTFDNLTLTSSFFSGNRNCWTYIRPTNRLWKWNSLVSRCSFCFCLPRHCRHSHRRFDKLIRKLPEWVIFCIGRTKG